MELRAIQNYLRNFWVQGPILKKESVESPKTTPSSPPLLPAKERSFPHFLSEASQKGSAVYQSARKWIQAHHQWALFGGGAVLVSVSSYVLYKMFGSSLFSIPQAPPPTVPPLNPNNIPDNPIQKVVHEVVRTYHPFVPSKLIATLKKVLRTVRMLASHRRSQEETLRRRRIKRAGPYTKPAFQSGKNTPRPLKIPAPISFDITNSTAPNSDLLKPEDLTAAISNRIPDWLGTGYAWVQFAATNLVKISNMWLSFQLIRSTNNPQRMAYGLTHLLAGTTPPLIIFPMESGAPSSPDPHPDPHPAAAPANIHSAAHLNAAPAPPPPSDASLTISPHPSITTQTQPYIPPPPPIPVGIPPAPPPPALFSTIPPPPPIPQSPSPRPKADAEPKHAIASKLKAQAPTLPNGIRTIIDELKENRPKLTPAAERVLKEKPQEGVSGMLEDLRAKLAARRVKVAPDRETDEFK